MPDTKQEQVVQGRKVRWWLSEGGEEETQKRDAGGGDNKKQWWGKNSVTSFSVLPQASSVYARQEGTGVRGRRWQMMEGNVQGLGNNFSSASFPESPLESARPSGHSGAPYRGKAMQEVCPSGALMWGGGRQGPWLALQGGHWTKVDWAGAYPGNHGPEVLCEGEPERCFFKAAAKSVAESII